MITPATSIQNFGSKIRLQNELICVFLSEGEFIARHRVMARRESFW